MVSGQWVQVSRVVRHGIRRSSIYCARNDTEQGLKTFISEMLGSHQGGQYLTNNSNLPLPNASHVRCVRWIKDPLFCLLLEKCCHPTTIKLPNSISEFTLCSNDITSVVGAH